MAAQGGITNLISQSFNSPTSQGKFLRSGNILLTVRDFGEKRAGCQSGKAFLQQGTAGVPACD
jgi:hypothetical protein